MTRPEHVAHVEDGSKAWEHLSHLDVDGKIILKCNKE